MHLKKRQPLHFLKKIISGALLFLFLFYIKCNAETSIVPLRSAAVVSKNIKPYYEALEGFVSKIREISGSDTEIFEFEDYDNNYDSLSGRIKNGGFSVVLAIGPEASKFISSEQISGMLKIYTMIVSADDLNRTVSNSSCGVSLTIPISEQISGMTARLGGLKRIGIIYDPKHNEAFVKKAEFEAVKQSVRIVRIQVNNHHDIASSLENGLGNVDALWMIPDQTVISESLVPFIIKKSISAGVPSVGYNRFFLQNGAAMAFIINYKEIGAKAAIIAGKKLKETTCSWEPPDYEIMDNRKILDMLKSRNKSLKEKREQGTPDEHN